MTKKNKNHGGPRKGAGRQLKYGEPTDRIYFNVPISKKHDIQKNIKSMLKKLELKK